ncbi:unnamed protein product, partial [Timema podura]|nr:unnamed protein product [Timema podura]
MYVAVGYKESFVNLDYCITPTEMSRSVREGKPLQKGKFCMGPVGQPVGGRITGPCVHVNRAGVMKKNNRGCHSLMKCAKRQDKDSLPLTSSLWCCEVEHEAEGSLPVTSLSELMCSPASAISLDVCNKNVSSTKTHQHSREFSRKAQNNQHILYLPTCRGPLKICVRPATNLCNKEESSDLHLYLPTCRGPLKICVRPATNLCNKEESSDLQYACGESPRKSPEKMHILHITTSSSDSSFHSNSNSNSLNCHEKPKCPVCHHKKKPFIYKVTKV